MNTCDTCKSWKPPDPSNKVYGGVPKWQPPLSAEEGKIEIGVLAARGRLEFLVEAMGNCNNQKLAENIYTKPGQEHTVAHFANAEPDHEYGASFRAGPKFGCIHHESK